MSADDHRDGSGDEPGDCRSPTGEPVARADGHGVTGEAGGPKGLEPTRYGDWERNGRCIDF